MFDTFFDEEFFNGVICEFRDIVTLDSSNMMFNENLNSFDEIYEFKDCFRF